LAERVSTHDLSVSKLESAKLQTPDIAMNNKPRPAVSVVFVLEFSYASLWFETRDRFLFGLRLFSFWGEGWWSIVRLFGFRRRSLVIRRGAYIFSNVFDVSLFCN